MRNYVEYIIEGKAFSINQMYILFQNGRRVKTFKYDEWKSNVKLQFYKQLKDDYELEKNKLKVKIIFEIADNRKQDIDNFAKSILDCMTDVIYEDDSQIQKLSLSKVKSDENKIKIYIADI